ncbi:MAG: diacylglycerol kinase [Chloroflexota bacterium]|nr:diacylglycerol kinase [Chloroflexota bacterium]
MATGRVRLVANASARGDLAVAEVALAACRAAGWEAELAWTEMRGHGVLLAEEAAVAGWELVLSVGGDGTAREVAAGLAGSETGLGIVPAGTGNSSYRELFGDAGWRELLEATLSEPAWRQVDLLRVDPTGEYSLLGFSAGWFAQIVALAESGEGPPGPGRYATAALQAVADPVRFEATVELDGAPLVDGELGLLTAGGARVRAAVFPVLPDSSMDDGLLDVLAVRAASPEEFQALLQAVHTGDHVNDPLVRTGRGRSLVVRAAMPLPIEIDGDLWDRHLGETRVVVVPGVLRVLAPARPGTM